MGKPSDIFVVPSFELIAPDDLHPAVLPGGRMDELKGKVAALAVPVCAHPLSERRHDRVVLGGRGTPPPAHRPRRWLGTRGKRPSGRTAEQSDELAPLHSTTSSAVASNVGGTMRPSVRAVWWLMTSSTLVDCATGRSAGFAPLRMRPGESPACR